MSPSEAADFGQDLTNGAVYFGVGPIVVLLDLPGFLIKPDPEPDFREPSLDEINAALRAQRAEQEDAARNLGEE
ncbi:hypothetical protein JNUCC0626_18295 [Lentzea sp. JNUCC 0626]|uniref:hypothetical protein n=1 Tax=Lentzea sp. JNUCC 0626 TaxID=3367513 RepID=UPI00374A482E